MAYLCRRKFYFCKMELRQLRYFVKTAETLNFSEAARSLFITQSTLSQQIKQLENELDAELFERNSHTVTLTENGERLLPLAKKTLLDAEDCQNQVSDLRKMLSGELNIGMTYSFGPMLTETVKNFMTSYPGVKLKVSCKNMEELMVMLRRREVDFVLAFKPMEAYEEIESHALFDDKLCVIMRNDHPLADRTSLTISDIERQSIALPAKGLQARQALDKYFDLSKFKLDIPIELDESNILLDIVQSGHIITLLSEASIYHRDNLKAIPLEFPKNNMAGCVHFLKNVYRKHSADVFLRMLSESTEVSARVNKWI